MFVYEPRYKCNGHGPKRHHNSTFPITPYINSSQAIIAYPLCIINLHEIFLRPNHALDYDNMLHGLVIIWFDRTMFEFLNFKSKYVILCSTKNIVDKTKIH